MKSNLPLVLIGAIALTGAWRADPLRGQDLGDLAGEQSLAHVCAVLYNERDPLSIELAHFYANRRGIPKENVIGLRCPVEEEITREQYEFEIARPLRTELAGRGLWQMDYSLSDEGRVAASRIRFLAIIKGMPLKIRGGPPPEGDRPELAPEPVRSQTAAAIDSELAALGIAPRQVSGFVSNPYYRSFQRITDYRDAPMLLVTRLDGPSETSVRRMIYDASDTEKTGLWGRGYFDMRGIREGGYKEGDDWIDGARIKLLRAGMPAVWDWRERVFPTEFPMDEAALYFGWYSADLSGPVLRADFRFRKGAVAMHLFSFSASTLRLANGSWAAALIDRGAAATYGNVYEPFLQFTTQPDLFADRLVNGLTFAEAAYAATKTLSWMNTFVGDPLYRPFEVWNSFYEDPKPSDDTAVWLAIRRGHKLWFNTGKTEGRAHLEKAAERMKSGLIHESLGALQLDAGDIIGASRSFANARKFYTARGDFVRTFYQQAEYLRHKGRRRDALEVLAQYLRNDPVSPESLVLRDLQLEIDPPPPPPSSPPPASANGLPSRRR